MEINSENISREFGERKEKSFHPNGNIKMTVLKKDGIIHSLTEPAVVIFRKDGNPKSITWYMNGMIHRDNDPSHVYIHKNGELYMEWNRYDVLHREHGPALLHLYPNKRIKEEQWYIAGALHRDGNKPAIIKYDIHNNPIERLWYEFGELIGN